MERKYARLKWLRVETQLAELDGKLKGYLAKEKTDTTKGLECLNNMLEIDMQPLMLKKHPHLVESIKCLRRYVGDVENWKLSPSQIDQFNQDAEAIRDIADGVYAKYMVSLNFAKLHFKLTYE